MPVLSVRISEKEKSKLIRRAKNDGLKPGEFVRRFINEETFVTGEDLLKEIDRRMGDSRLRIKRRS